MEILTGSQETRIGQTGPDRPDRTRPAYRDHYRTIPAYRDQYRARPSQEYPDSVRAGMARSTRTVSGQTQ